jgi:serine/threonine protein kinase
MSINSKQNFNTTSAWIADVHNQYAQALQNPRGDLGECISSDALKRIEKFGSTFKASTSLPLFAPTCQISQNITKTAKFLKVAIEQDPQIVPLRTRQVALEILSGKPDRFAQAKVEKGLGEGAFGKVELVNDGDTLYARKTLHNPLAQKELNKEYTQLITFQHERIMNVAYVTQGKLYLEFVDGGTLEGNLESLTPEETRKVLTQIADGLSYMHQIGSIHGDIKTDNIMLTRDKDVKIADLGLTKTVGEVKESGRLRWTSYHLPPEFFSGKLSPGVAQKIDVWSFGMLIWEMLKKDTVVHGPFKSADGTTDTWGSRGFDKRAIGNHLDTAKRKAIDPSGELEALMMKCFEKEPRERPTMYQIQQVLNEPQSSRKAKSRDSSADEFDVKRFC